MRLIVVGDVGVDVVVRCDGRLPWRLAERLAGRASGTDTPAAIRHVPGGAGANTAAWLAHLGAEPVLVARVGDDEAGRQAGAGLTAAGVRCAFTVDPVAPTCCVVVLVDPDGQRDMLSDRGASAALRPTDLDRETLGDAAHLHLSGYVLRHPSSRPAGLAALAAARAAGLSTSVDPQTTGGLDDSREFLNWVAGVDLLLPNADELESLTSSTDPASAVGLLDRVGAVVVTSGAAGGSWVDRDGVRDQPAPDVRCVDSTGAGDAFDAGLLASWVVERDPRAALRAGVAAGSAAVTQLGARPVTSR